MKKYLPFLALLISAHVSAEGFIAGTLVKTPTGHAEIQTLVVGDEVLSCDFKGSCIAKEVTHTHGEEKSGFMEIEVDGATIRCDEDHLFYAPITKTWLKPSELDSLSVLMNAKYQNVSVKNTRFVSLPTKLHTLTVKDEHNFYVSNKEIVTHNFLAGILRATVTVGRFFGANQRWISGLVGHIAQIETMQSGNPLARAQQAYDQQLRDLSAQQELIRRAEKEETQRNVDRAAREYFREQLLNSNPARAIEILKNQWTNDDFTVTNRDGVKETWRASRSKALEDSLDDGIFKDYCPESGCPRSRIAHQGFGLEVRNAYNFALATDYFIRQEGKYSGSIEMEEVQDVLDYADNAMYRGVTEKRQELSEAAWRHLRYAQHQLAYYHNLPEAAEMKKLQLSENAAYQFEMYSDSRSSITYELTKAANALAEHLPNGADWIWSDHPFYDPEMQFLAHASLHQAITHMRAGEDRRALYFIDQANAIAAFLRGAATGIGHFMTDSVDDIVQFIPSLPESASALTHAIINYKKTWNIVVDKAWEIGDEFWDGDAETRGRISARAAAEIASTVMPAGWFMKGAKLGKFAKAAEGALGVAVEHTAKAARVLEKYRHIGVLDYLKPIGKGCYKSPAGLIYETDRRHGHRIEHVFSHLKASDLEKGKHTIFNVAENKLLPLVDEGWRKRGAHVSGDPEAFLIEMGRTIGTNGETVIKIVIIDGTSRIRSAYPVK